MRETWPVVRFEVAMEAITCCLGYLNTESKHEATQPVAKRLTMIKSPLCYPGGIQKVSAQLISMFPPKASEFRDPTVGGGGVFVAANQNNFAEKYWINGSTIFHKS